MKNKNEYIINLQGKDYIKFAGLLHIAHDEGLQSINTELIELDRTSKDSCFVLFKATVSGKNGTFTGFGDASPKNVSKNIVKHLVRMAETRAICRALRWYTNYGITCYSELDTDDT